MKDFYPNGTVTTVDGQEVLVRPTGPNTYQAMMNEPGDANLLATDARVWPKGVRAIEAVTGCEVIPGSVANASSSTIALVSCR